MKTTLNAIKAKSPCTEGYRTLLKFLGKTKADDEPLALSTILESNGLDDTIWCFRAVSSGYEKELRLFAVFCARQVQHLMTDHRSINAIDVAERYANGNATDEELKAAHDAAYDAACVAACAAAYDASRAAANAAYDAAYSASHDAACAAAAYDASRAVANAAYDAAYSASHDAACAAANTASRAARAADPKGISILEAYLKELLSEK